MQRLVISSSQMCISREQEEFLAAYRTDEARQAFIDSYGKEKVNFLDGGYSGEGGIDYFVWFDSFVEYIEVIRNGYGPYIETDFVFQHYDNCVIDIRFYFGGYPAAFPMIISNDWHSIQPFFNIHFAADSIRVAPLGYSYVRVLDSLFGNYHVIIDNSNGNVEINGSQFTSSLISIEENTKPLKIFSPILDTVFIGKFYELKIYQDGLLIHHYLPVQKNGVGFVFDMVELKPWYNLGTGSFVVGPNR